MRYFLVNVLFSAIWHYAFFLLLVFFTNFHVASLMLFAGFSGVLVAIFLDAVFQSNEALDSVPNEDFADVKKWEEIWETVALILAFSMGVFYSEWNFVGFLVVFKLIPLVTTMFHPRGIVYRKAKHIIATTHI